MDGLSKKRMASNDLHQKDPAGWVPPFLRKRKRSLQDSPSDESSREEPSKKKTRPNSARQPSVKSSPVEVIEIVDSDDSDENENGIDNAQQIEPTTTDTALLVRNENHNATSSSRKAKDTIATRSTNNAFVHQENDHGPYLHRNEADTDTALSREEKEMIESATTDSFPVYNDKNKCTSLGQYEPPTAELANTDTARTRYEKANYFCPADINKNDADTSLTGSFEDVKEKDIVFFQTHCWVCHVQLTSEEDEVCCYAMHTHPVLNTPLCSVCYDIMEDVVREHSVCAGCGEETETAFLCDNIIQGLVCQNEFCFECVEKAGLDASELQASKDEWHCLACNPTLKLRSLCTSDQSLPIISERTTEDILHELAVAEEKKRDCEEALEETNVLHKSQEIQLELRETVPESELGEVVEEELVAWKELLVCHEARLGDFISKLQDELEARGIDMVTVYHSNDYLSIPTPALPELPPQWVETANQVNAQRKEYEKALPVKPILPVGEYKKDYTDDIIEIAELDAAPDIVGCKGSGWVKSLYKPTLGDFREAQVEEDKERARRKIRTKVRRRTEIRDKDIMKNEGPRIRNTKGKMVVEPERKRQWTRTLTRKSVASLSPIDNRSRPERAVSTKESLLSQDSEIISVSELDGPFVESDEVLCTPILCEALSHGLEAEGVVRRVSIAKGLACILKGHQKDGVRFIWRNSFCDFDRNYNGNDNDALVGGCILAHHMGLGKTLTTIALLHTVLTHPAMVSPQHHDKMLRTVVLVVPVNTLANWKDEFTKWFVNVSPKVCVYAPSDMGTSERKALISKWMATGGIFLVSSKTLSNLAVINGEESALLRADILVIDEAHTMIKNSATQIFKILSKFETKRRILLSGSPFQNNLLEYYHICNFIRDGVFGVLSHYKEKFLTPISHGQAKDSTQRQKAITATLSADLRKLVDAHIHRKDLSVLERDLPKLSQVVIHVRPSHVQSKIYRTFDQARSSNATLKNFFKMYSELSPVHNHPSCLRMKYSDDTSSNLWCRKHLSTEAETTELDKITAGNKIVLLLHLIAFAEVLGEKVLIFSQYIPTLDYIESVLKSEDWISQVPSLSCFSGQRLGGWVLGRHYMRLDGSNSSTQRGQSINAFNEDGVDGDLRAFLISSVAGSLGINLTSASRVILVDSHFNPTVVAQAVCRAYRFGQFKPVHCYRLLTEGTMEEKIYGRSVNKTGLALRLIDSKAIEKSFSAKELEDFQQFDTWVQCDQCEKWRMLTGASADDLPERWFCDMNTDHHNNSCDLPERDQAWYLNVFKNGFPASPQKQQAEVEQPKCQPEDDDELLSHLIAISESKKGTSLISRHYYHDSLLQSRHDGEEVEDARILLASESVVKDQRSNESKLSSSANLTSLLADEAAAKEGADKDQYNKGSDLQTSAYPIEPGQSLEPLVANEGDSVKDHSSKEPEVSGAANSTTSGPSVAPVLTAHSTRDEASSSEKAKDEFSKTNGATERMNEKPVRQSLSNNAEIIDLCDSSDDDW